MKTIKVGENAVVRQVYRNATENYIYGSEDITVEDTIFYTYDENDILYIDISELYKHCLNEFGKCISKVYIDTDNGATPIGWVFSKKVEYDDSNKKYTREVWVTIENKYPVKYVPISIKGGK